MLAVMIYGLLIAGVCTGLSIWIIRPRLAKREPLLFFEWCRWEIMTIHAILWVVVWVTTPLWYEFPEFSHSVPVTFGPNGQVIEHRFGMITLGREGKWGNLLLHESSLEGRTPAVTLLTDNPKVRKINHLITVRIIDPQKFYSADPARMTLHVSADDSGNYESSLEQVVRHLVISSVYDMNNAHSRDLASLFNPLDEEQQDKYHDLVSGFLNPALTKDGIAVATARFSLD